MLNLEDSDSESDDDLHVDPCQMSCAFQEEDDDNGTDGDQLEMLQSKWEWQKFSVHYYSFNIFPCHLREDEIIQIQSESAETRRESDSDDDTVL